MDVLYGRNPILESLRAGRRKPRRLCLGEGVQEQGGVGEILRLARDARFAAQRVSKHELNRLVGHRHHQGIALETSNYPYVEVSAMLDAAQSAGEDPFLLILDQLQDPQNVGTLLRTAEGVGVHGVILPRRRAVRITPAVVSSSSGAVEHLLIARETNLARTLRELREAGVWLYGLDGRPEATPYHQANLVGPIALVVGAEGAGLRRLVRDTCDTLIRLPMRGRVESLNAAAAGSVALYAVWGVRRFGQTGERGVS
jgi:23S rRNA (guanosine2251-2'-O)-methyltransferase